MTPLRKEDPTHHNLACFEVPPPVFVAKVFRPGNKVVKSSPIRLERARQIALGGRHFADSVVADDESSPAAEHERMLGRAQRACCMHAVRLASYATKASDKCPARTMHPQSACALSPPPPATKRPASLRQAARRPRACPDTPPQRHPTPIGPQEVTEGEMTDQESLRQITFSRSRMTSCSAIRALAL